MKGMKEKKALEFLDKHGIRMVDMSISIPEIDLNIKHNASKKMNEKSF